MRKTSSLVILSLLALAGTARAEETIATTPAVAPEPAKPRKLLIGASFLPMALGKFKSPDSFVSTRTDEAFFAYGVGLSGSYEVLPGLLVGVAPQLIFNVQAKPSDAVYSPPMKELDLMARVAYAVRPVETISVYAEVLPGFSDIMPSDDASPSKGLVLGFGVGCMIDMADRFFANVGAGYQIGFQNTTQGIHTLELRTQYVRIAMGGGYKF